MTDSDMVKIELDQVRVHMDGVCQRIEQASADRDNATRQAMADECGVLAFEVKQLRTQVDEMAEALGALGALVEKLQASPAPEPAPVPAPEPAPVEIVEVKADPEPAPQWPSGPTFDPR